MDEYIRNAVLAEFSKVTESNDRHLQSLSDDIDRALQQSRTHQNGQKPPENFSPWTKKTRKKSKDRKQVVPNRR